MPWDFANLEGVKKEKDNDRGTKEVDFFFNGFFHTENGAFCLSHGGLSRPTRVITCGTLRPARLYQRSTFFVWTQFLYLSRYILLVEDDEGLLLIIGVTADTGGGSSSWNDLFLFTLRKFGTVLQCNEKRSY